jgi:hypothetical protein
MTLNLQISFIWFTVTKILPHDLIHDLLEFHIVPNMKPKANLPLSRRPKLNIQIDSTLIESKHIPLFVSWIDKKNHLIAVGKIFLMILNYYIVQVGMELILVLFIKIVIIKELLSG